MRKLFLLRGLPGSGKSTFIQTHKLAPYTLSADDIRLLYAGPVLQSNGLLRIPADNDRAVWQQLFSLLENRMLRGETVIIDATHTHPRSFTNYKPLAQKYRYQVFCIDFSQVPFEVCQARNEAREEFKVVPPLEMKRMYDNMQRSRLPDWLKVVEPEQFPHAIAVTPQDVSQYKAVHHIGDIQGCFTPLREYFDAHGIQDDELYVFVGDYLDRGIQNAEVMQWLLENYQRPNFIFVEGNHEAHLRNWVRGVKARSIQFNQATAPVLEAAGIPPKKVYGFLYKLREMYYYTFSGCTVLVSHGGLSTLPEKLAYIPSMQFIKGAGLYEEADESDESFARTTPDYTYQVHGHRNRFSSPTKVNEKCFNLEGKVEFGGELRVVVLDKSGFSEHSVRSSIDVTGALIEPIGDVTVSPRSVSELVDQLRSNKDIYEKPQPDSNISSFNFTRDVFTKKRWDSFNVRARGLFINTNTNQIVARSYEKFFNVGERQETKLDALASTLRFPVQAWVKENGYLGLVGYDSETDELVFASKSSLTSDFAKWLKEQFNLFAPEGSSIRQKVKEYLATGDGRTIVFEVIEPENDPHVIAYDKPSLVILDIIANTIAFEAMPETDRQSIAELLGCPLKQKVGTFKDANELHVWLEEAQHFEYTFNQHRIEGFVLEDAEGYMIKVKLPWYSFWRQMRTQLAKLQAGKKPQMPSLEINPVMARKFLNFMSSKSSEELQKTNIVALRDEFLRIESE